MSDCKFSERVAALASGEPDDELGAHLSGCATCRAELDDARRVLRELGVLAEPARRPGHAGDPGEPFWSDFSRAVRVQYAEAKRPRRAWWAWLAAPALCTALGALLVLGGHADRPHTHSAPAPALAAARDNDEHVEDLLPEADPDEQVENLDDDQLDDVLAQLDDGDDGDDDVQPADDANPEDTLDTLDDDDLDRVFEALVPGKGA